MMLGHSGVNSLEINTVDFRVDKHTITVHISSWCLLSSQSTVSQMVSFVKWSTLIATSYD